MKPVEIEFLMKDMLSPGLEKNRQKTEDLLSVARKAGDTINEKINEQRKVVDSVSSALDSMERKLDSIKPGQGLEELSADLAACRKLLADEVAALDSLENQHRENTGVLEGLKNEYEELNGQIKQAIAGFNGSGESQDHAGERSERLSSKLRALQDAMARMRIEGQQDTEEFRSMAAEAAKLSDTITDLRNQTKILSNDDANLQGFVSGINGLAGGITAATGAISLFAGENENLVKIQTRVQSVMATTMGLQQVFNSLNKDSAFRLVTVARAKNLLATATKGLATALGISNTAAKALMGTLTLGLSAAVSGMIYLWDKYTDAQEKAIEKAKELAAIESDARAERIKAHFELDAVRESLENYTGSKEEEHKKVDELNAKYGEAFGYYNTVSQWYDTLTEKSGQYIETLFLQAKMQALVNKATEADQDIANLEAAGPEQFRSFFGIGGKLHRMLGGWNEDKIPESQKEQYYHAEITFENKRKELEERRDKMLGDAAEIRKQIEDIRKGSDLGGHEDPNKNHNTNQNDEIRKSGQLSAELLEIQRKNQQAVIDQMEEGSEKKRKQLRRDYELELAELDSLEQKWREQQKGNLTQEQNDALEAARALATIKKENGEEDIRKDEEKRQLDQLEAARSAWQQYYIEYGTFEEKRVALAEQYADRIAKAETAGEKASLQKQLEEKVRSLGFDEFKASINFADVFGNLEPQSTEALSTLRGKLRDYINNAASELRPQDLEELSDAIERIDFKIDMRRPFESLRNDLQEYRNACRDVAKAQNDLNTVVSRGEVVTGIYQDESGNLVKVLLTQEQAEKKLAAAQAKRNQVQQALAKSVTAVGEKMRQYGEAASQIAGVLENDFGIKLGEDIHTIIDGFNEMTEGVTNFGEALASGNIAGAIGSVIQTIGGLANAIGGIFGIDLTGASSRKRYEEAKEVYESYMGVLDKVIGKQLELVGTMSSADFLNADNSYEYAKALVSKQEQAARNLGKQYLSAGAGLFSHSNGVNQRKDISDEGWREFNALKRNWGKMDELGLSASMLDKAADSRMAGLFDLSSRQLEYIMTNAPTFWAQLHDDTRSYLEEIISCGEEWENVQEARKESLTGITFDEFYGNWKRRMKDMSADARDLAEDIEDSFRDAFLDNMLGEKYEAEVRKLYERWADMTESDGKITEAEIESLRQERDAIAERMIAERNLMAEAFGWTGEETATTQSGRAGGFNAMSQDQGTKLEGMFTSGLMHWASIDQHVENVAERMSETAGILSDIKEDTGNCSESLRSIEESLSTILRDGVKTI